MTLLNQTSIILNIDGKAVNPEETVTVPEVWSEKPHYFHVHSEIGSLIITSYYAERTVKEFGRLTADTNSKELTDCYGLPQILIYEKEKHSD